jgi:GNAT superfamily N-acetyltransferase
MRIIDATASDLPALSTLAMSSKAVWGYEEAFMMACREELTVRRAHLYTHRVRVAVDDDGSLLGFHGVVVEGDDADLAWLFVAPDAQRRGVGEALFADAGNVAKSSGARTLIVESDPNAVGFYEAQGAELVGTAPSVSIEGRVLPVLHLALA